MAYIAVTYSFTNSTTADATQVNQNFQDLVNGLSDGTKDLSVNAVTTAGNLSVSGNTTIGNASGDDLTVTASLASTIPIKTTNTYDIGSSTLGLRAAYFGANSQTVKIQASSSVASTITVTLPLRAGTVEVVPTITSSQTGTYAILSTDDFIPVSASGGSFTATLPTAVGAAGKMYRIKRTDQTLANAVTIATTSSQTIDGVTTRKLMTQYEEYTVISDNANWQVLSHFIPSKWTSYTTTWGGSGSNPAILNGSLGAFWRRIGDSIQMTVSVLTGGTTTYGTGDYFFSLPTGLTIDTAKLPNTSWMSVGSSVFHDNSIATRYVGSAAYYSSTTVGAIYSTTFAGAAVPVTWASSDQFTLMAIVPVTNWEE